MRKLSSPLSVLALFASLLVAHSASAQLGISAAFTAARLSGGASGSASTVYGPTLGLYYEKGTFLALGGDVRASFLRGSGLTLDTGAIGPRAALKFHPLPLQVYAEALGGFNSFTPGTGSSSSTHVDYQLLGGLDATFFPRLDWRVIEYSYTNSTDDVHANSYSTGIVFRLPY